MRVPPQTDPLPSSYMKSWESLIDQKIREAMEQGEFDDLPGKGEPVDLSANPFEDPELRLAHRMLHSAGFAPAWIEERKDIEAELAVARNMLARVWTIVTNARGTEYKRPAEARWEQATVIFRKKVDELNHRIRAWNLKAAAGFQQKGIDAGKIIEVVQAEAKS